MTDATDGSGRSSSRNAVHSCRSASGVRGGKNSKDHVGRPPASSSLTVRFTREGYGGRETLRPGSLPLTERTPHDWAILIPVTAGTHYRDATVGLDGLDPLAAVDLDPLAAVALDRLRAAVAATLEEFLDGKRRTLGAMSPVLVDVADELCALARGGKRLRPAFAYWGWRGAAADAAAPAEDDTAVLRAVAALEVVHVSALVHDDLMDGAAPRRGRPATHIGFAAQHGDDRLAGDADSFGV